MIVRTLTALVLALTAWQPTLADETKVVFPHGFSTIDCPDELWSSLPRERKLTGPVVDTLSWEHIEKLVVLRHNWSGPGGEFEERAYRRYFSADAVFDPGPLPAAPNLRCAPPMATVLIEAREGRLLLLTIRGDYALLEDGSRVGVIRKGFSLSIEKNLPLREKRQPRQPETAPTLEPQPETFDLATTGSLLRGNQVSSVQQGSLLCQEEFGSGWSWAEFHDQLQWSITGRLVSGHFGERAWVWINDQPAECHETGNTFGMTWILKPTKEKGKVIATCVDPSGITGETFQPHRYDDSVKCNPYSGDTPCSERRALLCIKKNRAVTFAPLGIALQPETDTPSHTTLKLRVENQGTPPIRLVRPGQGMLDRFGSWGGWTLDATGPEGRMEPFAVPGAYPPVASSNITELGSGESFEVKIDVSTWIPSNPANGKDPVGLRDMPGRYTFTVEYTSPDIVVQGLSQGINSDWADPLLTRLRDIRSSAVILINAKR